jgi:dipeptidyl aminopeptidase/acylaminoacyl peptidase
VEERIELQSKHNKIVALLRLPGRMRSPCVILCHGLLSSKDSAKYVLMSEVFCLRGLATVRFDFHGCGESGGELRKTTLSIRLENLDRVFEYVASHPLIDRERIGLLGSSLGAVVSLAKAALHEQARCAVLLSVPLTVRRGKEGFELEEEFYRDYAAYDLLSIARSSKNVLVVHGTDDEVVPLEEARTIFSHLSTPKEMRLVGGADHTFSNPSHRKAAVDLSLFWLRMFLLKP